MQALAWVGMFIVLSAMNVWAMTVKDETINYEENVTFSQKEWEFGLAPVMIFEGHEGDYLTDEIFGVGFHVGYRFADHWLGIFDYDYLNDSITYKGLNTNVSIRDHILGVAYELRPYNTRWNPYVTLGYDYRMISVVSGRDNNCITVGGGLKYRASYNFMVNLDLKARYNLDINEKGVILYLGVNFMVDKEGVEEARLKTISPAVAPATITVINTCCNEDQDQDGVLDRYDECPNTPIGIKVDKYGCPRLQNLMIHFDVASANIKKDSMPKIDKFAHFMRRHPEYKVMIIGHTDDRKIAIGNQRLSEERAFAVKKALIADGIAEDRIMTAGKGASQPIADNNTSEGRAQNRRIEAYLYR